MTLTAMQSVGTDADTRSILRTIRAYMIEWNGRYPDGQYGNDFANQFSFLPGAFDASLARGVDVVLSMDMDGRAFSRTGDGTLRVSSDSVGLLVEADIRDGELIGLIDDGRIRGWSHKFAAVPSWGRVRSVDGIQLTEFHRADLRELTAVVRKRPRQLVRATPVFLSGGPMKKGWKNA